MASETKWVVSKYAPETGERFKVKEEFNNFYLVAGNGYLYVFLKSEYILCPAPERWEKVPIDDQIMVCKEGRAIRHVRGEVFMWCDEDSKFSIIDGALVLERRGSK